MADVFSQAPVVALDTLLTECHDLAKFLGKKVSITWQHNIREESITGNLREPVLQIEFVGQVGKSTKLAVLGWSSFMQHWKFKPKELIGLCTVDHFQIGKQFVLQKAAWTAYLGKSPLTVVFRVTFNQPDEKDTPGSNSFALVDWRTYLMLREAMNA